MFMVYTFSISQKFTISDWSKVFDCNYDLIPQFKIIDHTCVPYLVPPLIREFDINTPLIVDENFILFHQLITMISYKH